MKDVYGLLVVLGLLIVISQCVSKVIFQPFQNSTKKTNDIYKVVNAPKVNAPKVNALIYPPRIFIFL